MHEQLGAPEAIWPKPAAVKQASSCSSLYIDLQCFMKTADDRDAWLPAEQGLQHINAGKLASFFKLQKLSKLCATCTVRCSSNTWLCDMHTLTHLPLAPCPAVALLLPLPLHWARCQPTPTAAALTQQRGRRLRSCVWGLALKRLAAAGGCLCMRHGR
jgi:hypothetical protein